MAPKESIMYWIILGTIFILAELMVPGWIMVFIGLAAFGTAVGIYYGYLTTWVGLVAFWALLSAVLILIPRQAFARFAPGETLRGGKQEDYDPDGLLVDVLDVDQQNPNRGNIIFRGTVHAAQSRDGALPLGGQVGLLERQADYWIVEPRV